MPNKMQTIDPAERAKIYKLQEEKGANSSQNKVEWLYSGDKIDRDAYLLGKPIDKLLIEKEIEKPKENTLFSNTIDLANKIREDPLFEIKKREIEAKKKLLENPLRIKQLQQQISELSGKRQDDSDSDSRSSKRKKSSKHKKKEKSKKRNDSDNDSSDDDDDRYKKHKKRKDRNRSRSKSRSRSRSRSRRDRSNSRDKSRRDGYGLTKDSRRGSSRDRDHSAKSKGQLEIEEYKRKIEKMKQLKSSEPVESRHQNRNVSSKLSEEEKQRRLAEMQQNAKWRNDVRTKNVSKYKREDNREESENNTKDKQAEASSLFNNMMRDAYISTEDRIKRNIKNIQRNESAFDKNFVRK